MKFSAEKTQGQNVGLVIKAWICLLGDCCVEASLKDECIQTLVFKVYM